MSMAERIPIWLCADDYGISPAVNKAIRDLVMQGRLNATTVMVVAPSGGRPEAASLDMLNAGAKRVAIGLHVTLTGAFRPISAGFRPTRSGTFLSLEEMFARGALRLLNRKTIATEIAAQVDAFVALFGRTPDFVDGHQHVHLFPRVREVCSMWSSRRLRTPGCANAAGRRCPTAPPTGKHSFSTG